MRLAFLRSVLAAAALLVAPAAHAATLIDQGITYELDLLSVTGGGFTGNFALKISGVNSITDPIKGRTGINAFSFNDPAIGTATGGTSTGFTFQTGGLNATGCNGSGNFFCFSNTSAVFTNPLPASGQLLFSVTSNALGSWETWAPDFKIDWTGSANNYSLVSQILPITDCRGGTCPGATPFIPNDPGAVPEPATWLTMIMGFALIGGTMRRSAKTTAKRVNYAI
jgi:hypothetical protein